MPQEFNWKTLLPISLALSTKIKRMKGTIKMAIKQLISWGKKSGKEELFSRNPSFINQTMMSLMKKNHLKMGCSMHRIMCSKRRPKTTTSLLLKTAKSHLDSNNPTAKTPPYPNKPNSNNLIWAFLNNPMKVKTQANPKNKTQKTKEESSTL